MKTNLPLYVTQPSLPALEDLLPMLQEIWDRRWLTNNGPFHQRLETELARHLGVEHLSLFSNGTLALMTAMQAQGIQGEVITTPFSFIASSNCILYVGAKPVFVDICPKTLNMDPTLIEKAITRRTKAILAVETFGNPAHMDQY
ncbi:MAG: DegT/DnrJ/EryC1/StrS family aminotransferase, partial [Panacagrimonas sp.]